MQIHQTWTDLREARVKDGFIFRVSRYFIDHWLRLLGSKVAWTVVDLQQRCYLEKADRCRVSLKDLCAVTGVRSPTTMQAIVDKPLTRWFFAKQNTRQRRAGKVVRGKNRYTLQMSDPLTPEHQGQVARLLAERLRDGTVPAVRSPDDLIRLVSDLSPLPDIPSEELPAWASREPLNLRQIVFRILSEASINDVRVNLADESVLQRAFADAQARITRPTRIALATHYFRTEWVSHLGATNAWLIMALRSRCYWNKTSGELRDSCVMSMQELADLLGTSTRTVIRSLQDPLVHKFVAAQGRVYERRASDGRKIPSRTRFQVHLTMDPLTPPDEAAFGQILISDAARYGLDPSSGQMNMLDILDMMSQMTSDEITRRRGQWGDKNGTRLSGGARSGDKIEIRRTKAGKATLASSDSSGFREHGEGAEIPLKTGSGDNVEVRSAEPGPVLPPFGSREGGSEEELGDKIEFRGVPDDRNGFRPGASGDKTGTISIESGDKTEEQYSNTFINTTGGEEGEWQQQYPTVAAALSSSSSFNLRQVLVEYGIEEPALSQILGNAQVTPELARAWMLYADNEPGLKHKAGYVVRRLIKVPPDAPADPDLLLVASLSAGELTGCAQRRALELRMGASVSFGDERREAQYRAWLRFYGSEKNGIGDGDRGGETALDRDGRRASRWQPDVG